MNTTIKRQLGLFLTTVLALTALAGTAAPASAHDDELAVRNGGFEAGSLTGWRTDDRGNDGDGWSVSSGTVSPVSGFVIPPPPQGRWQAVADQVGPGSHILYRDIAVDDDELGLTMTLWYRNRAGVFVTPRTLDEVAQPNQQLRIDLLRPGAPLRSMAPGDILATVFRTRVGDPVDLGPRVLRTDLSRFEDRTVRLRIAEVDNQFFFQVGVDAVRLVEIDDDRSGHWRPATGADLGAEAASTAQTRAVHVGRYAG